MIIETDDGIRIDCREAPEWNEFWQRYYVPGYRWIKSKKKWSTNSLIHNFKSYREVGA